MRTECSAIQEVSLVLIRDGKVCLLRRCNTGYMDGKYCFPAGHKEPGEVPHIGAAREGFEESGVRVDPAALVHAHTMHRSRFDDPEAPHERVSFFFTTEVWEGEPSNVEPEKSDHVDWFTFDALPDMIPYMRHALECIRNGVKYSEFEG